MTLTIADRWSVTLRVHSLARVTLPPKAATPATHALDTAAMAARQQVHADLAAERAKWEAEAFFCGSRRMS
jgi:hypothetical protein